jgi:hypothetical protein
MELTAGGLYGLRIGGGVTQNVGSYGTLNLTSSGTNDEFIRLDYGTNSSGAITLQKNAITPRLTFASNSLNMYITSLNGNFMQFYNSTTSSAGFGFYTGSTPELTTQIGPTGISSPSFNATSDYRIKENIKPIDLFNINIDGLNPVTYINKKLKTHDIGLIAHEVQEIFPYLVNGEKDGKDMQSIRYMSLICLLIKEVQELKTKMKEKEKEQNPNKTLLIKLNYNQSEKSVETEKIIQIPQPGFYLVICGENYENPNITASFWATVGKTSTIITPIQIPETYQIKSSPESNAILISAKLDPQYTEFDVKYTKFT